MSSESNIPLSEANGKDPLSSSLESLITQEAPSGLGRRAFLMRSAMVGAMAAIEVLAELK